MKTAIRAPVLLVDDRRANLIALEAVLESPELELVGTTSGEEALAQLEQRDFAVVLLDVQMPGTDGIDTALEMRKVALRLGRHAPIIFVTAVDADPARIRSGYAHGAVDFIQKPFDADMLRTKVSVFAQLFRARDLARQRGDELAVALEDAERYRLLVESVKDYAIIILDPNGHIATWNQGAERIKGWTASEILGKHFSIFYRLEDADKPARELEVAAREGIVVDEGWRVRKDGSQFWAAVTITAMRTESGDLVGFAKVTRDLTEQVWNEERLRKLAAENAVLEATATAEKTLRVRREFLAKTGAALASSLDYGATLATVVRLAVPELADWCTVELIAADATTSQIAAAHPSNIAPDPHARARVPEVIRSGRSERLESAIIVPLSGHDRVLGAMSFGYASSSRRYTQADLAFAEDFAHRAGLAIENAQAHAAVSSVLEFQERFVAILGHDLRNPLAAIDMGIALLKKRSGKDAARVFERLESSSHRMSRMVEQILDLTRTRLAGGLEIKPVPMDLSTTLGRIVEELRTTHASRAIDLHCHPAALTGDWDPDRLEQVFSNLISNAIHYGHPEQPVTVEAREEDEDVVIRVHNRGTPIPEEVRSQLFDPFRRGSRGSRVAKTAGLGLGLYISREIVVGHGGAIDVESSLGAGTTFRVTLPRQSHSQLQR